MNSAQFHDQAECYLCGCTQQVTEREQGTAEGQLYLRWVRCTDCGLTYLNPRPSTYALSVLYDSSNYWKGDAGYQDYLADERWRRKQARDRALWFFSQLRNTTGVSPRVLEVGSAAGFFLQELDDLGVAGQGLDISRPMVRLSGKAADSRIKVTQGSIEQANFPDRYFDGLVAWGCDSNFDNPVHTFKRLSNWLKPGGLLAFNFHEYDHWSTAFKGRFKFTPNALYFLNRSHVLTLMEKAGFELISMRTEFCWMNLASVYHHTGHIWLTMLAETPLARVPLKLPVPGSFRVLARRKPI